MVEGKRSSHSDGNKLFENKGEAVLAVQLHFLAVCVSENSKPRLLLKERGGGERGRKRGRGVGVCWISTNSFLSMAWSLGLGPRRRRVGVGGKESGE